MARKVLQILIEKLDYVFFSLNAEKACLAVTTVISLPLNFQFYHYLSSSYVITPAYSNLSSFGERVTRRFGGFFHWIAEL